MDPVADPDEVEQRSVGVSDQGPDYPGNRSETPWPVLAHVLGSTNEVDIIPVLEADRSKVPKPDDQGAQTYANDQKCVARTERLYPVLEWRPRALNAGRSHVL